MNNNFSISAKAVIKTALVIALTIFIFEFRVHIGFLLLFLAVLALLLGLLLLYAGTFQPATVKKYAEQAASSYAYLKALIDKTFNKQTEVSSSDNRISKPLIDLDQYAVPLTEKPEELPSDISFSQVVAPLKTVVPEIESATETLLGDTTNTSEDEEYLV